MVPPPVNPHKKGEHVFNDIAGSIANAFQAAIDSSRLNGLILPGPYGPLRLEELRQTTEGIERFRRDRILIEARTIAAPATGIVNDANSRSYSDAKLRLEQALSDTVAAKAAFIWSKKPRSNSSFQEFEQVVKGLHDAKASAAAAITAFDHLIDSAHDPAAEKSALSERISDFELKRRSAAINAMKQHRPALKQAGIGLLNVFFEEIDKALERRITPA
jgi:hypothetical protein